MIRRLNFHKGNKGNMISSIEEIKSVTIYDKEPLWNGESYTYNSYEEEHRIAKIVVTSLPVEQGVDYLVELKPMFKKEGYIATKLIRKCQDYLVWDIDKETFTVNAYLIISGEPAVSEPVSLSDIERIRSFQIENVEQRLEKLEKVVEEQKKLKEKHTIKEIRKTIPAAKISQKEFKNYLKSIGHANWV